MFKLTGNVLPRFSLLFVALSLAACGGGGGSSGGGEAPSDNGSEPVSDGGSDPTSVASVVKPGIFTSTITESGASEQTAFTLLSSNGKYSVFSTDTQSGVFGTLTVRNDDTLSDENGTYVFFDGTWQPINGSIFLKGSATTLEEFSATFTGDTTGSDVDLEITGERSNGLSDLQVTMQDLSETYTLSSSSQTTTITIEPDGTVIGTDTVSGSQPDEGCLIDGSISIPNSAYNIFEGTLSFTNCASVGGASSEQRNGDYPITGFLQLSQQGGKELVFAGTNGQVRTVFIGSN